MAPGRTSIYLTDPQRKFQGAFNLSRDNFLDALDPNVFLTIFLLNLGADRWP